MIDISFGLVIGGIFLVISCSSSSPITSTYGGRNDVLLGHQADSKPPGGEPGGFQRKMAPPLPEDGAKFVHGG
jgi:hypothetical protein